MVDDANAAPVAEICARLDGMPLAIELAAAHATLLAPEEIIGRLDDALTVLVGGPRDAPPRQQTLRATLDWSHALLDDRAADGLRGVGRLLRRMHAPSGRGCPRHRPGRRRSAAGEEPARHAHARTAACRACGCSSRCVAYAAERFMERRDVEDVRRSHCEYYVRLAELSEPALRGDGPDELAAPPRRRPRQSPGSRAAGRSAPKRPELGLRLASALGNARRRTPLGDT